MNDMIAAENAKEIALIKSQVNDTHTSTPYIQLQNDSIHTTTPYIQLQYDSIHTTTPYIQLHTTTPNNQIRVLYQELADAADQEGKKECAKAIAQTTKRLNILTGKLADCHSRVKLTFPLLYRQQR